MQNHGVTILSYNTIHGKTEIIHTSMVEDGVPVENTVILPNFHIRKLGEVTVFHAVEVEKLNLLTEPLTVKYKTQAHL